MKVTRLPQVLLIAWIVGAAPHVLAQDRQRDASYVLGPDDQILIRGADLEDINDKQIIIGTSGNINLPLVGRLHVTGLTVEQLEATLTERLKAFIIEPQVSVQVTEFRSQPVSVIGNVGSPGIVQLRGRKNLYEIL